MKKKLYSIITAVMILFACVFASACGDKYKNMEFRVLYAYSENADEWYDGSNGISLNYGKDNTGEGNESSLVFNENGVATLYVKIEIKNVKKKKYVDSITVSFASLTGLNFSEKRVRQDEVFAVPITGNVDTILKLYENNSGKKKELPFIVSKELDSIEANLSIKPAIAVNGTLSLLSLNNLTYHPQYQTNQVGVSYTIDSFGSYDSEGGYLPHPLYTSENLSDYAVVENGILKIKNGAFFGNSSYIIKIKATSLFHDGSENEEDAICAYFDVYVVDVGVDAPIVKFYDNDQVVRSQINIYENGGKYSTSKVVIDTSSLNGQNEYFSGLNTHDGKVAYSLAIYVMNENGEYEKYSFNSVEHQSGINGLMIKNDIANQYEFLIVNRNEIRNKIKFVYEIEGLNFSFANIEHESKELEVVKGAVPTFITVNDSLDLIDGSVQDGVVYGTSSSSYKGLKLKLSASPNDDPQRLIYLTNPQEGLILTDEKGNTVTSELLAGDTIYVKFKTNVTVKQTLTLKTLNVPTYYNEQENVSIGNDDYIEVSYSLDKLVTADKIEFVDSADVDAQKITDVIVDAKNESTMFVKVFYRGVSLDSSTIKLSSDSDAVLFENGTRSIYLNANGVQYKTPGWEGENKFDIYAVTIKPTNNVYSSRITISAGEGEVGIEESVNISSVYLLENNSFAIKSTTSNVRKFSLSDIDEEYKSEFDSNVSYFAISKGEFAQFAVEDGDGKTNTITKIEIVTTSQENGVFSRSAISHTVISNSTFDVVARIGGKTQILNIKIYFYYEDKDSGSIKEGSVDKEIQIAVYDGVGNIRSTISNSVIGYANPYYEETGESTVNFSSYTSNYGQPASSVEFAGTAGVQNIQISHASQVLVSINNYDRLRTYASSISISFVSSNQAIDLMNPLNNGKTIITQNNQDFLNGEIEIKLNGPVGSVDEISLSISALRFGVASNVMANVVVKITEVDVAERILVSGQNLVETSEDSHELQLSFIDVEDGGYDQAEFNASLQFKTTSSGGKLRFDDIDSALTHVLYEYTLNEDGTIASVSRIQNDFLNIAYQNGAVIVRADKNLGGGLFKLVLATKDSYLRKEKPSEIIVQDADFATTYAITIRVEDGISAAFTICDEEELNYINNNLDKKFVLGANLDLTGMDTKPLGLVNNNLRPFEGSLSGSRTTILANDNTIVEEYSITLDVASSVDSNEYGSLYGLFAILGQNATIENLKLNAKFATGFANTLPNGIKVGALAGVNNGLIKNVEVILKNSNVSLSGNTNDNNYVSGVFDFGGIVGLNNKTISNSRVESSEQVVISSGAHTTHNIGSIAGTNAGEIAGAYLGKQSLDSFIFDVVANLKVENTAISSSAKHNVGAIVGTNKGVVENLLVGGQVVFTAPNNALHQANLGGIAGVSGQADLANDVKIDTVTALSLDLTAKADNVNVGGIVADMTNTTIHNSKFVSVETIFTNFRTSGVITGQNLVAGLVANATNGTITNSSVEGFIQTINNKIYGTIGEMFATINGGTTTAGLVANISGTNVEKSFVNANIASEGSIVLTTGATGTDTYFIGKVDGNVVTNNATYSVVDSNGIVVEDYLKAPTSTIDAETIDWSNIYVENNGAFEKAESFDDTKTYKEFDVQNWLVTAKTYVSTTWTDYFDDNGDWSYSLDSSGDWKIKQHYNAIEINGVEFFFPYLIEDDEAIMIIAPQSISANVDKPYVAEIDSVCVIEFDWTQYEITESLIVNYFNRATEEENAYQLISDKNADETSKNNGLFDVNILPVDAQGLYKYEILGSGRNYAYINSKNQIVFTGVSGSTPILIRIYSGFNPDVEAYVAIYTQSLLTKLKLNSASIYSSEQDEFDYEINAYTGQSKTILTLDAENRHEGYNHSNIFNVYGLSQYLTVGYTTDAEESKLEIEASTYSNMTLKIKDDASVDFGDSEIVTFSLYLKKEYFAFTLSDNSVSNYFVNDIKIAEVKLKVYLYNSAKNIEVDGEDEEKTTHDDISFAVKLTTDYVDVSEYTIENGVSSTKVEVASVDGDGNIVLAGSDKHDSIKIVLDVIEGETEKVKLTSKNNVAHFAELFNLETAVISQLYLPENATDLSQSMGYVYNVLLELKDEHNYRYIVDNIKFNILVYSTSNPEVNNENDAIEILLKPTMISTARIENYKVQTLNVNTDYSSIVTHKDVQTSIIEPGSLGNVMMIYLEPTYSNVTSASIKTSELNVPSLGKNVKMKFTQLVLDYRKNSSGVFTTLYGEDTTTQVDDALELKLISTIDASGNRIYNGVVCVYIQLEYFSGLEGTMTVELNVTTNNGTTEKTITRTREMLTTYLPGTKVIYDEEKQIADGYLIQKGTSTNQVQIKIYGYQFNSNPEIVIEWNLQPKYENGEIVKDENGKIVYVGDYTYLNDNKKIIVNKNDNSQYAIGNYVSYYLEKDYDKISYNSVDDSYTLTLNLNVSSDIKTSFSVGAQLSLATKDGQLETSSAENNKIVFYPTDYILDTVYVDRLSNGTKPIAINKSSSLELAFTTDNANNDLTDEIYVLLLEYVYGIEQDTTKTIEERLANIQTQASDAKNAAQNKLGSLFSYYKNGGPITFADLELHPEFEFNLVNGEIISILGVSKFTNIIQFKVWFGYCDSNNDGIYELNFGSNGDDGITTALTFDFTLNVYAVDPENEIPIYSADEIYDSETGTWELVEGVKYVLMNDIEIENLVPITTPIAQLDGNNRVISIKSFMVNPESSEFGLFANIGNYTYQDQDTEETITKQTILKNVIVDYSKFNGTLALNNNTSTNLTFGGLVGSNNGGLIYNCDVINLSATTDAQIDIIVGSSSSVVFGGLVGSNSGIITNSRVGRDAYTKIIATKTTESSTEKKLGGLNFKIYHSQTENDKTNQFSIIAGGLVGSNSGTIATSYISNTNLVNYSTNETTNRTAGLVGNNSGTISYSFAKADDSTITTTNPYSTGYVIENKGNGIVSGFVYENTGTISNSYSNIELQTKSAYIAGFVYTNSGIISESYAATTMNSGDTDNNAEQPFVGVDNAGNLLSNGTLENTYYLMRSDVDTPYKQGDKDVAQALNKQNFQNSEYLVGFAFVLSNIKADREQGIWSYYTLDSQKRILPELMNANVVAHSYRYVVDIDELTKELVNSVSFEEGTANNPYTVSSVEEFNKVFTVYGQTPDNQVGYVRFINNIDFNDEETAIKTRSNYTLGSNQSSTKTSIEGNGMTISGIYLDAEDVVVSEIGLFASVQNAYIKNLNLEFATPTTNGQFSTTTATYSGGLAGKIKDSVILNIKLHGESTTLTGNNFVGGVAGLISGKSLVYGIETNLNVKASATESFLYYDEEAYEALNMEYKTHLSYSNYLKKLSYAGGVAGVLDLQSRVNVDYNVQFINVRGDQMNDKTFDGKKEANILAEYAGGVAGYASTETNSFRLKYYTGTNDLIRGNTAVGGLFAVSGGSIVASQVTAEEDIQFGHDTTIGDYIIGLEIDSNATLDTKNAGNLNLLEGYKYVGGLVGVGLNSTIKASYSKVGIVSGEEVGGLIGVSVGSIVTYSYSIPYINSYDAYKNVGGLIGSSYGLLIRSPERNDEISEFEAFLNYKNVYTQNTNIQFTYSTLIMDKTKFDTNDDAVLDYIAANYQDTKTDDLYLQSNSNSNLTYVYAGEIKDGGIVKNQTKETSKSAVVQLFRLFSVQDPDQIIAFQEVFSGWSIIKYWSLKEEKYFPLLINETVDNFIDIDSEEDFEYIRSNPDGNYRIIKDIEIHDSKLGSTNWVIAGSGASAFSGILLGEKADGSRPKITITAFTPDINEATSGFFEETREATISNIEFVWNGTNSGINLQNINNLKMVSGLTCQDSGSLISNVEVRTFVGDGEEQTKGYFIADSGKTIAGFGGIVGNSKNTNILGCSFIGKLDAVLKDDKNGVYVGGIVGRAETNTSDDDKNDTDAEESASSTSVINNSLVGARQKTSDDKKVNYPTTSFKLTIANDSSSAVHIGGVAGYALTSAIASSGAGGFDYSSEYQTIDISVALNNLSNNVHIGGVVGLGTDGLISHCNALVNITVTGESTSDKLINIGGLAGSYSFSSPELTSGISACNVKASIKTFTAIEKEDGTKDIVEFLQTGNDHVRISTGVAYVFDAEIEQCLFYGEIDTEGSDIPILYAGGAVAYASSGSNPVVISEVITYSTLNVGTTYDATGKVGTSQLYAGGLVGQAENVDIHYSASWGRVVPITNENAQDIYAGGLIGRVDKKDEPGRANINNSYTISSIVADSIAPQAIANLNIGALIGSISKEVASEGDSEATVQTADVTTNAVYYSSDYALCADENYVEGNPLGTNLSAQTIIYQNVWHEDLQTEDGKINGIWTSLKLSNGSVRLPHLTSLEDQLIGFDIIDSVTGDFVSGYAMRPIQISTTDLTYSFDENSYNYYLLTVGSNNKTTPTFPNALNGILIGQDLSYEQTFIMGELSSISENSDEFSGIIPGIKKHSAVSNLHIKIETGRTIDSSSMGVIAGLNNGVIFNCSVQGSQINFTGTNIGLIANKNKGLISHAYSTAEVISGNTVGGIVLMQGGKLLSNYFTGYIEASTAAGILINFDQGVANYAYNNYMGGVINTTSGYNAFTAADFKNGGFGSRNFIDIYSDVRYAEKGDEEAKAIVEPVSTSALMSEGLLDGEWYHTVENGKFKDLSIVNGSRINNLTFGVNYNYPVYRFNKVSTSDTKTKVVNDWKNQLPTGTGEIDISEDPTKDAEGNTFTLEERYGVLISGEIETKNYQQAYKIPHLGILSSVNALIDKDRNYVVIYDLDASYMEGDASTVTMRLWNAIGSGAESSGFKDVSSGDDVAEDVEKGFKGVFITNRYYNRTTDDEIRRCVIENLSNNGLFANIKNSYFGDIKLGSFDQLTQSGALGTNIGKAVDESENENEYNVCVNNVSFEKGSLITGSSSVGESETTENNYYGGLFGLIGEKTTLTIVNFSSSYGSDTSSSASLRLKSAGATVGLIAGKSSGKIIMKSSGSEDEEVKASYIAWFDGNHYAGGVVGEMNGGSIDGGNNTINISKTKLEGVEEYENTTMLGGVVGRSSGSQKSIIENIEVRLYDPLGEEVQVLANSFGGAVGEVLSAVEINQFTLNIKGKAISFEFVGGESVRYYGLIAGIQENTIDVAGFALKTEASENGLFNINVFAIENPIYEDDKTTCGIGTFVGSQNGNLTISGYAAPQVQLTAKGVPNLGGVSGYYKSGNVSLGVSSSEAESKELFILIGTTNVGGAFGYCNGDISIDKFAGGTISLLAAENPYAKLLVDGSDDSSRTNFGGLVGKWNVAKTEESVVASLVEETEDKKIVNKNEIVIGYSEANYTYEDPTFTAELDTNAIVSGTARNIGGVVGKMTASGNLGNLLNEQNISCFTDIGSEDISELLNGDEIGEVVALYCKAQNVGGVIGLLEPTGTLTLTDIINMGNVYGYQNVGGLIGYVIGEEGKVKIVNGKSVVLVEGENLTFSESALLETGTLSEENVLKGLISGIVNVGGAIGYAGNNVSISQVYSKANVYGNVNIGGLVGLAENVTMKNNYIQGGTDDEGEIGTIKGVYYIYGKVYQTVDGDSEIVYTHYIPTSVGGLIGTSFVGDVGSEPSSVEIKHNVVDGVNITTSKEGSIYVVIKTNENPMASIEFGTGNALSEFNNPDTIYNLSGKKRAFDEIETGFGGFAGTINSAAVNAGAQNNYLRNIDINAELGVNVGTYYGAYAYEEVVSGGTEGNVVLVAPTLYSTNSDNKIYVDGAYNVGGIVGFINGSVEENYKLKNSILDGNSAKIQLQTRNAGLYVGGLVGKTNANTIGNKDSSTGGLTIANSGAKVQINISTSLSYYVGALIGKAEVSGEAYIRGDNKENNVVSTGSDVENFGGLIGMLKCVSATDVTVDGEHYNAFTINTIENSNYTDGDSKFNSESKDSEIFLYAEAHYINNDKFSIVGSSDTTLYFNDQNDDKVDDDGAGIELHNPLLTGSHGWSKQYTGFAKIQRRVPQEENNGADWDAVLTLYDASKITHVATIASLGLTDQELPASSATWERSKSMAKQYGINVKEDNPETEEKDEEQILNSTGENNAELSEQQQKIYDSLYMLSYNPKTKMGKFSPNYICYTVYKQSELDERLYSAIGIAKAKHNFDDNSNQTYETLKSNTASFWEWLQIAVTEAQPPQQFYLNLNSTQNPINTMALTYFKWGGDKDENGKREWLEYKTLPNDEGGGTTTKSYQYDEVKDENKDGIPENGSIKSLAFFIEGYMAGAGIGSAGDAIYDLIYPSLTGAYFEFEVVYENETVQGLTYNNNETISSQYATDSSTAYSGSIFDVAGIYTDNAKKAMENAKDFNWTAFWLGLATFAVDVAITVATWGTGTGAWQAGKLMVKQLGKKTFKTVVKTFTKQAAKTMFSCFGKMALKSVRKMMWNTTKKMVSRVAIFSLIMNAIISAQSAQYSASENYASASYSNFGFLGSTYYKTIRYEKISNGIVKLAEESDDVYVDGSGATYVYYSGSRPSDFNVFLANQIFVDESKTVTSNGKITKLTQIYPDPDSEAGQSYLENLESNFYIQKTTGNFTGNNKWYYTVSVVDAEKTDYTITDSNGYPVPQDTLVGYDGSSYWALEKKYIMHDGMYYINAMAGEPETYRVMLDFTPEKYKDPVEQEVHERVKPNYIETDDGYYVHGTFNGTNYEYVSDSYTDNNLQYSGGTYSVNGVTIEPAVAETTVSAKFAATNDSTSLLDYLSKINLIKPNEDSPDKPAYQLGYDYFDRAYYTANGIIMKDPTDESKNLVKYATFEYVEDVTSLNYTNDDLGTKGVGYIVRDYVDSGYHQSNTGAYLEYNGNYYNINSYTRYSHDGTNYVENSSGNFMDIEGTYVEIKAENRYVKDPTKYGLFTLVDTPFATTGSDTISSNAPFDVNEKVIVPVYPSTFVNPYSASKYPSLGDSVHDYDRVVTNKYIYYFVDEGTEDSRTTTISFDVKYFVYEGGYLVNEDYTEGESPMVYLPIEKDSAAGMDIEVYKVSNLLIEDGQVQYKDDGSYKLTSGSNIVREANGTKVYLYSESGTPNLINNWNDYKFYYIPDQEALVCEIYQMKNGTLYMLNDNYTLEDNLLHKVYISRESDYNGTSMYEGMYLTNAEYGLYTRYRHKYKGNYTNLDGALWDGRHIMPQLSSSYIINNGVATNFVESVKVTLNGGNKEIYNTSSYGGSSSPGSGVIIIT